MTRNRIAAMAAAVALLLATLTGCPVQTENDDEDGEEEDYIHYTMTW